MDINWYPGHMAKTKRQLSEQLSRVDVVVELCDARLPYSSRNPDLDKLISGKKRVLLLNKADLADQAVTSAWLNHFRAQGIDAAPYNAISGKVKDAMAVIDRAAKETVERAAAKGMRKTVKAMVVGVPNVGKSTFINKVAKKKSAIAGDRPGVTRGKQWVNVDRTLDLLDTPGILWPKFEDERIGMFLAFTGAVKDDVMDVETLGCHMMNLMVNRYPDALMAAYKLSKIPEREEGENDIAYGYRMLEACAFKRGMRISGGEFDTERMARVLLDEYRASKLGRFTLEIPEEMEK